MKKAHFSLDQDAALVLFEILQSDSPTDNADWVLVQDELVCALEKALTEPFSESYVEDLNAARARLRQRARINPGVSDI